jgi:hypothetical protein
MKLERVGIGVNNVVTQRIGTHKWPRTVDEVLVLDMNP